MEKQYEIGNLITEQRKRKNLTQRELADTLGVTDKSVSKWENGRSLPDTKIMPRLCEVLGISVEELLEGKLKPLAESQELDDLQRIEHVYKYYSDDHRVNVGVSDINLTFNLGERVVITGPSGSGKTTLLKMIGGIDRFERGEIFIRKEGISRYDDEDYESYRKDFIAYIFQEYGILDHYSIIDNLIVIRLLMGDSHKEAKQKAKAMLEKIGLSRFAGKKAYKLSGGQKQKLSVARALLKDSPIVLGDEITSSLDKKSAKEVLRFLFNNSEGKLVVLVSHHFEEIEEYCTRRIVMADGSVIKDECLQIVPKVPSVNEPEKKKAKGMALLPTLIKNHIGLSLLLVTLALIPSGIIIGGNYALDYAYEQTSHRTDSRYFGEDELLVRKPSGFSAEELKSLAYEEEGTRLGIAKTGAGHYSSVASPDVPKGTIYCDGAVPWFGTTSINYWEDLTPKRDPGLVEFNIEDYLDVLPVLVFLNESSKQVVCTYDLHGEKNEVILSRFSLLLDEALDSLELPRGYFPEGSTAINVVLPNGTSTDKAVFKGSGYVMGIPRPFFSSFSASVTEISLLCPSGKKPQMKERIIKSGYVCLSREDELGYLQDSMHLFVSEALFAGISIIAITILILISRRLSSSVLKAQTGEGLTLRRLGFSAKGVAMTYASIQLIALLAADVAFVAIAFAIRFVSPVLLVLSTVELLLCTYFFGRSGYVAMKKQLEE
ncbi:MAG: ATP-binding cassette domain-containing protein [Bacilli bacterium]|nr:ATP-binding cassette domain-containing protein [Bacilli bacterium]